MALSLRENIAQVRRIPRNDDVLMGRAELLRERDRDLVEAVMLHGQSAVAMGRLMGVSHRSVRSRVQKLCRHLCSRRFLDAARALSYMSPADAKLTQLRFCAGMTLRQLSAELGLTEHHIRRRLDRLSAQIAMIRRSRHPDELADAGASLDITHIVRRRRRAVMA